MRAARFSPMPALRWLAEEVWKLGLANIKAVSDARLEGRFHTAHLRKVPAATVVTVANWWHDLSGVSGNPLPNYYASTPLAASLLEDFKGLFHGDDKSPAEMYITKLGLMTPSAALLGEYKLLDYLLYYPFIDGDDTDLQPMDNTVTLTRYASTGGRVMAVCQAPTTGGGSFTYSYLNQAGVAKTSPTIAYSTTASNIGNLVTTQPAVALTGYPFLPMAENDTGVTAITGVQNLSPTGGLICFVIVQDLATLAIREINAANEMEFISSRPGMPLILDGAYLNYIMNCAAAIASTTLSGYLEFIWSD